jgi:hypothetical protein
MHLENNAMTHVEVQSIFFSAFRKEIATIPAEWHARVQDKPRCPDYLPERFSIVTDITSFLIDHHKTYRALYAGAPPVTVTNVCFGAAILEGVRALTMALEPHTCNLPLVFPLFLQFHCYNKDMLQFAEIPLPTDWRMVLQQIDAEFFRMTLGSRNWILYVFATSFSYYGQFLFNGRLMEMIHDMARGRFVGEGVQHLYAVARNVNYTLSLVPVRVSSVDSDASLSASSTFSSSSSASISSSSSSSYSLAPLSPANYPSSTSLQSARAALRRSAQRVGEIRRLFFFPFFFFHYFLFFYLFFIFFL